MELLISGIRRLQVILLKVSLLFGVQVYAKCGFLNLVEPTDGKSVFIFLSFYCTVVFLLFDFVAPIVFDLCHVCKSNFFLK